jgi:hypothetical protein
MKSLYAQLQTRPFVKLAYIENIQELATELGSLNLNLLPYTVEKNGIAHSPLDLDVTGLIDRSTDPDTASMGWNRGLHWKNPIVETDLAAGAPKIMQAIYQLFDSPWIERVKISRLAPNTNMKLHRHAYLDQPGGNNEVVVHIALETNSGVTAVVVKDGRQEQEHFALGEVWYLNTRYPHKFKNSGNTDRYHLWINLVWDNKELGTSSKLMNMVKLALDNS